MLSTERLVLRPVTADDHAALLAHWTQPDVRRFLFDGAAPSAAEVAETIEESIGDFAARGFGIWLIELDTAARLDSTAAEKAKHAGVQIKLYAIIYELIDQVKEAMAGLLEPDTKETIVGSAEVRKVFELSKGAPVAGCMVSSGRIVRGKVRIRRRKDVIYEGVTQSLRRFQDEVNEVRAGMECGIRIEGFGEFEVGDLIECYSIEKVAAKL